MSLMSSDAVASLRGLATSPAVALQQRVNKHRKTFRVDKLGNRGLMGAALLVEPSGLEIVSGHLLCRQNHVRWYFLQDVGGTTLLGRGTEVVTVEKGHSISVSFGVDLNARNVTPISERVARVAQRMNEDLTCAAVLTQPKWKTALAQLPSDMSPLSLDGFQPPTLMATALFVESDDMLRELIADLASVSVDGLYRAHHVGRTYRAAVPSVVSDIVDDGDGYMEMTVAPAENLNTVLRHQLLLCTSDILVKAGDDVDCGTPLFTMFPDRVEAPRMRYGHDAQRRELLDLYGGDEKIVTALNHLFYANEVFRCDQKGHIAVPYHAARLLSDEQLKRYGTDRDSLGASLVYDLTPISDRVMDEASAYCLLPIPSATARGSRWLSNIALNVSLSN